MKIFDRPLVVFDLESTGTDVVKDRIVEFGAMKMLSATNYKETKAILVNPGMPISNGAFEAHGITDEMVADKPSFSAYARSLHEYLWGCNVAGYNCRNFDVPMLSEEFARCGIKWPDGDTKIIDAFNIYRKKEPRDLAAAVKFYTGSEIQDAHSASGDVVSTARVLLGQLEMYPDLTDMTPEELDSFCVDGKRALDVAGKIVLNDKGEAVYAFGKSIGVRVVDDPGFGQWMLKNDFASNTKAVLRGLLGVKW